MYLSVVHNCLAVCTDLCKSSFNLVYIQPRLTRENGPNQSRLSEKILKVLQESKTNSIWDPYTDLYIWILYMGGAFAQAVTRDEYGAVLRQNYSTRLKYRYSSWTELHAILCEHMWCEANFARPIRNFWEESVICGPET